MHGPDWLILLLTIAAGRPYTVVKQMKGCIHFTFGAYGIVMMTQLTICEPCYSAISAQHMLFDIEYHRLCMFI